MITSLWFSSREAQEKTEWGCQASLAPQDLQGLWSMCRMRM